MDNMGSKTSYLTSINFAAEKAWSYVSAATAAIGIPAYSAMDPASTGSLSKTGAISLTPGISLEVTIAETPGAFSAKLLSIEIILAWACGERKSAVSCVSSGRGKSSM